MNYAWELMMQADKMGVKRTDICFVNAKEASPYMEISLEDLNAHHIGEGKVEINPLYRFHRELGGIFDVNIEGMDRTREIFLDICMHYIVQMDLREGLSRQEFYLRFLWDDFLKGQFGEVAQEAVSRFDKKETAIWVVEFLHLYKTGGYLETFKRAVTGIYHNACIYENNDRAHELLIYLGVKENIREQEKINFLIRLLLPIQQKVHIFYDHHFGIIGIDETMKMDEMMIV